MNSFYMDYVNNKMKKYFVRNKRFIDNLRKKRFVHEKKREKIRKHNRMLRQNGKLTKERELTKSNRNIWWVSNKYQDKRNKKNIIKNTEVVICPSNYSFINNTEEFIDHLNCEKNIWKRWKCVDFNLENIEELTFDSLCLLLASTKDKNNFPNWVKWNFPKNPDIKQYIRTSGFLFDYKKKNGWMFNYKKSASDKKLSLGLSKKIIDTIREYTFSWEKKLVQESKVHPFMIEAMKNTDDHAWDGYNRWVFYQKSSNKITKVCFLDLWEWILNSMYNKIEQIFRYNPFNILWDLFKWNLTDPQKRTKTKEDKRWTWLPKIYDFLMWNHIQNAFAITNNVKYDVKNDKFYRLNSNFHWTFYYREIKP